MKNNLKFLVESSDINIVHMARELEVSRGSIYRVINGGVPSAELMLKLSNYFKKDAREIFFIPSVRQVTRGKRIVPHHFSNDNMKIVGEDDN